MLAENASEVTTTLVVPEGYELSLESTEPIWFGPEFENQSFAQWDFKGFEAMVIADNGRFCQSMTVEVAKEVHRQIEGILMAMGEMHAPESS